MRYFALLLLLLGVSNAQEKYKLCATDKIRDAECRALQRGGSEVSCVRVTDSAECAIRLARGEADFGVFNPEELLLAAQFYPKDIVPLFQLKHPDRVNEEFEFQSVAVIPADVTPYGHATEFKALKNSGFCHPGFSEAQGWNDYVLKYFERKVAATKCKDSITIIENEAENIKNFFGSACRPGEWATDSSFDETLKKKYPELCSLCDDQAACTYSNMVDSGHVGALECLKSGRGNITYVALYHVREHLQSNDSFQFLCEDGTVQPLSTEAPCAWIKQPWSVIASRQSIASELTTALKGWLDSPYSVSSWTTDLNRIIREDNQAIAISEDTSLISYLSKGREVDLLNSQTCNAKPIKWCAIGELETNKCKWVAKEAEALGIEPHISCNTANSTFQCFRDIANGTSDIITIDSNYGHLARTVYGLTTVLYSETDTPLNSVVIAVVKENSEKQIKSFRDLEGRKACFPEYGGIAWLSFIHVARTNGIISSSSCDYPKLVGQYLSGACTPGIRDGDHSNRKPDQRREEVTAVLCSSCPTDANNTFCAANKKNKYFGDRGALDCLENDDGDVAFIEMRNLNVTNIDQNKYRVLCKNGSLASYTGFKVDSYCYLSETIDSEIVGRRNTSDNDILDTTQALLKIENWLGYRVHTHRPIRIYDKFNNTMDLLFKDSTSGLVNTSSTVSAVLAYKDLFRHVDICSGATLSIVDNLSLFGLVAFSTIIFSRVL